MGSTMIPYNYIDLLTLDKQNSRFLAGQKVHLGHPGNTSNNDNSHDPDPEQQPSQIQVNSTIDADIVLRRVIEDRAAILALQSRAATNRAELAKAKTRQIKISSALDRQDQEVTKLTSKAKLELSEYNEHSKSYIRSFMLAFERGDLDILPHHPFAPSLEELEEAINRRKAMLIEKVQADDRVKKLEFIDSQERVTLKVMQMNEEAFLRAIEIAKQQYNASCKAWLARANNLLSTVPHDAKKSGETMSNVAMAPKRPKAQAPIVFRYPPPKRQKVHSRQQNQRVAAKDLKVLMEKKVMNPDIFVKQQVVGSVSPEQPGKRPVDIGSFQPRVCSGLPLDADNGTNSPEMVHDAPKRQKTDEQSGLPQRLTNVVDLCLSPVVSHHGSNHTAHEEDTTGSKDNESQNNQQESAKEDRSLKEAISIAQVLTSLHGNNGNGNSQVLTSLPGGAFAVANI